MKRLGAIYTIKVWKNGHVDFLLYYSLKNKKIFFMKNYGIYAETIH